MPTETPFIEATRLVEPSPVPNYHVEAAGGSYTSTQESLNNSASAKEQETRIQRWLDYWVNFDNRPFALNTNEIHWKYVYNNTDNPTQVLVLLEAGGQYNNKLFIGPI